MVKRALTTIGLAAIFAMMLAVSGLAQNGGSHPVEGTYNVESKSSELGAITFVLVLKREGGKWMGEIKDSPMPLAIS
ncbi:MAG: hypothetical protein SF339_15250, partial [Blastocatellia bacterium]|nr:hypothetical protein [Blastocatellia bacterium]